MKIRKFLVPVLTFMAVFTVSCKKIEVQEEGQNPPNNVETPNDNNIIPSPIEKIDYISNNKYFINNKVGYTMSIISETDRNPQIDFKNEGLPDYPLYMTNNKYSEEEKNNLLKENDFIRASDNNYNKMDKDGNLYLNDTKLDRSLYKHTASDNNYLGNVDINEKAVVKKITIYPDKLGSYVTGLYAAAGEVIKISISNEDLNYLNNINEKYNIKDSQGKKFPAAKAIIGQKQERETKENNIWPARDFVRMPLLANTMNVEETTTYVGSYLGGPVYIDLGNKVNISPSDRRPVTFIISGAVEYHHYIHGLTTKEDYARTMNSSAPFFELAVTDDIVRFSGARKYATNVDGSTYTYDDAYECAKLWTKISKTSHRVPVNSTKDASISFLFEPFVAAGAAVAFPGRSWVNAPLGWFSGALDSHNFRNNGAWGDIHEFNHHHQKYGTGTDNDRLEVSNNATSLLSYVSHTNISSKRQKNKVGVMGDYWNEFTNPEYALKDTLNRMKDGTNYSLSGYADLIHAFGVEKFINITNTQYTYNLPELTNNDERWYYAASLATGYDMTYYMNDILKLKLSTKIKTIVKNLNYPVFIPASIAYQTGYGFIENNKVLYSDTTLPYEIKSGEFETIDLNKDLVLPQGFDIISSTLTKPNGGVLNDKGNHVYEYYHNGENSGEMYLKVDVKNNTLGLEQTLRFKLEFNVKNNNKVIIKDYTYDQSKYNPNTPSSFIDEEVKNGFINAKSVESLTDYDASVNNIKKHHIVMSVGKIYIPRTATYQFGLKADKASYLYISKDNINYELKAYTDTWTLGSFDTTGTKGFTLDLKKGDYIYFKLVTGMPHNDNGYGELGWGIKTNPGVNPRINSIDEKYIVPIDGKYVENDYKKFPLEDITLNYEKYINNNLSGYNINDDSCYLDDKNTFGINNIFDNDQTTRYHSKHHVSKDRAIEFSIDLGNVETFNAIEFTNYNGHIAAPSEFKVYIGDSKDNINTLVKDFKGLTLNNNKLEAYLDNSVTTRYVRIVVTKTTSNQYMIVSDILFKNSGTNYYIHHDSTNMKYEVDKFTANYDILGTFGKTYDINNGHLKFIFKGTGFIINSGLMNNNCELIIKVDNIEYKVKPNSKEAFKLENLIDDTHVVEVKVQGSFNFDSISYYK